VISENPRPRPLPLRQLAAALIFTLTLSTSVPAAGEAESSSLAAEGGAGVGAMLVTLVYSPLKLAYAASGLVLSGLTWMWTGGDSYVARRLARQAVGGDYVVTPSHLEQKPGQTFAFSGDY